MKTTVIGPRIDHGRRRRIHDERGLLIDDRLDLLVDHGRLGWDHDGLRGSTLADHLRQGRLRDDLLVDHRILDNHRLGIRRVDHFLPGGEDVVQDKTAHVYSTLREAYADSKAFL